MLVIVLGEENCNCDSIDLGDRKTTFQPVVGHFEGRKFESTKGPIFPSLELPIFDLIEDQYERVSQM